VESVERCFEHRVIVYDGQTVAALLMVVKEKLYKEACQKRA